MLNPKQIFVSSTGSEE